MKDLKSLKEIYKGDKFEKLRSLIDGADLVLQWDKIIESPISSKTEAVKFLNGTLYLEVISAVWANELIFLKEEIIKKLNQHIDQPLVKELKFIVKGEANDKGKKSG